MRIVSLLPSATEILFALGLGDNVVGVSHECDFPPAARTKQVVIIRMDGARLKTVITANIFNVSVQMLAPRWVTGRALSAYQAAISGGIALGSWFWGLIAGLFDVSIAILSAAVVLALLPLLARWLRMPSINPEARETVVALAAPHVALPITERNGPIIVTVEYRVNLDDARSFHAAIEQLHLSRRRNGARQWSISQDIEDPMLWTERFQFATWLEYLRHRDRPTLLEKEQQRTVRAFHRGGGPIQVRSASMTAWANAAFSARKP